MATNLGTKINFGFATTANGATITNLTGLLQSCKLSEEGDVEEVKDGAGDLASEVHYNRRQRAVISVVVTGSDAAAAITNTALASNLYKGKFCPITACANLPELVDTASTGKWRILESSVDKSNTTAAVINLTLEKAAGIAS